MEKDLPPWNDPTIRWVCEQHPEHDFEHRVWSWRKLGYVECAGPGMPKERCYYADHRPVWDGQVYVCLDCWLPFGVISKNASRVSEANTQT